MNKDAYNLLEAAEDSWWYRGRSAAVRAALSRVSPRGPVLDFGAGYGGMQEELSRFGIVTAFEPVRDCALVCNQKPYARVIEDREVLEKLHSAWGLIGAFDVIEHLEDDQESLSSMRMYLRPDGLLALTVPAFMSLWSSHDETHGHYRRYTRRTIRTALLRAGFEIVYLSYWNASLFIPTAILRAFGKTGAGALKLPRMLDRLITAILIAESWVIRVLPLPVGTSLVVVARPVAPQKVNH